MIAPKLAYRNLMGAKLRTWLNIIVLSMAYVIIIWQQGFLDGWKTPPPGAGAGTPAPEA